MSGDLYSTERMTLPDRESVSRRTYLKTAVAVGGSVGLTACVGELTTTEPQSDGETDAQRVPTGDRDSLPDRQHAWNGYLSQDAHGNYEPPAHHVLRYLSIADSVALDSAREQFETALTDLESAFAWSSDGLLFTVGYSPRYFTQFDEQPALPESVEFPEPTALTDLESPTFDTYELVIHFASDRPDALLAAEEALFGSQETVNGREITAISDLFDEAESDRRTGFVGAGLPAENQDVEGIPSGNPVPEDAPLFMGFRSGFERTQATEDRVTIEAGPFAGGTTQHISKLQLQLNAWWNQENHFQRVAKMFSPRHATEERVGDVGEKLTTDSGLAAEDVSNLLKQARDDGVVGHAQKTARAREDGRPVILRRDFDTTDDDHAGLHFVSLQRSISDFAKTRAAMTGTDIADESGIGPRVNNGIMQYIFVRNRGNFLIPPRSRRSFPTANPEANET